jgi:hypothetical protein
VAQDFLLLDGGYCFVSAKAAAACTDNGRIWNTAALDMLYLQRFAPWHFPQIMSTPLQLMELVASDRT